MTTQIYSIGDIKKDLQNVGRLFESSDTLGGINSRHIKSLEEKFKNKTGRNSVFVSSCTNGIYLALKKLKLQNEYVIMPTITFFGIASAIIKAGGIPLYSRVDEYGLMDIESVYELLDQYKVRAVIPSHINNRYVNVPKLDVIVIEDAAPAFGMKRIDNSCVVSATTNTSVISFSYGKPLTAGEGGMILGDDADWYRGQRYCGLINVDGQYGYGTFNVEEPELKLSNTAICAAIVMNKMRSLEQNIERTKSIAKYYDSEFGRMQEAELYENGNHQTFVILSDRKLEINQLLENNNVKSYYSHRPVYLNHAFSKFSGASRYKAVSESYFHKILHIPCRSDLTDNEVNLIATTVKKALINERI
jgi:dTDP-4-amino-4,6-dideoxygalactose transaminase